MEERNADSSHRTGAIVPGLKTILPVVLLMILLLASSASAQRPLPQEGADPAGSRPGMVPPPAGAGLDLRTAHRFSGYAALLLAGLTAVTSSEEDIHCGLAWAATGMATAACVTGYLKYARTFDLGRGLTDRTNLHVILGVGGTLGMLASSVMGQSDSDEAHASLGVAGGVTMTLSVIVIMW